MPPRPLPMLQASPAVSLPCYPCPHASACCSWGTQLSEAEAGAIAAQHGGGTVYRTRWGEWRTRVRGGRCVFHVDNTCSIHATAQYPAVCRHFPHLDADGASPYPFDPVCPELGPPVLASVPPACVPPASAGSVPREAADQESGDPEGS